MVEAHREGRSSPNTHRYAPRVARPRLEVRSTGCPSLRKIRPSACTPRSSHAATPRRHHHTTTVSNAGSRHAPDVLRLVLDLRVVAERDNRAQVQRRSVRDSVVGVLVPRSYEVTPRATAH
jgi:hypothetical protein